jgi:putative protein-disulfide isomerase
MPAQDKTILYVADPMCSWCWGFAPVIAAIARAAEGRAAVRVVVGGLRPGTTEPMDDESRATVRHHWEEVHKASGQPFSFDFFERDGFVYDTEPPCRAAATVRGLAPDATLPFFESLHRAFYADGRDITDGAVLADLAADARVDRAAFTAAFESAYARDATVRDFQFARSLGITGFPTVVVGDGNGYAFLTIGYRPYAAMAEVLGEWLET